MEIKQENITLTWLPKKTFEISVSIPWTEIKTAQDKAIEEVNKGMEIKGFRKGKAPKKIVLENINPQKLLELTLNLVIPAYYNKAITKFGLKPIISPKIELVSSKENEDWVVKFVSCEVPDINLKNYKDDLKKERAVGKIWKPGEKIAPKDAKQETEDKEQKLQKTIEWLLNYVNVEIGDLLLEQEVNHKLAQLLDQTQKLGLTVDQYLLSTGKTLQSLKNEYRSSAEKNIAFEFILQKIGEKENIQVTSQEIDKVIADTKNEEERKKLEEKKYFLASLLRQQKTLDFLANLV